MMYSAVSTGQLREVRLGTVKFLAVKSLLWAKYKQVYPGSPRKARATNFTILKSLYLTSLHFYFSTALFIFITDP